MSPSDRFYADLAPVTGFARAVDPSCHVAVPDDWCVALTDVRGSTAAIEAGRYKDVNAIGAASIVAVLNAAGRLPLPYVFGGDGATLLFPASLQPAIERALRAMRTLARERMELELRVGIVPVAALRAEGHDLRVARFQASPDVSLAMLSGSGVVAAEDWVKDPATSQRWAVEAGPVGDADLDGFECRWEPLRSRHGQVVSLLVKATGPRPDDRTAAYRRVLATIDGVLGDVDQVNPAHPETLHIAADAAAFDQEARLRGGRRGPAYHLRRLLIAAIAALGRTLLRTGWRLPGFDGARYRDEVVRNTDFRKFDETLRMVIDVSPRQLAMLREALDQLREEVGIAYGLHTSDTALMTCLIISHEGEHVHFVDGADGGYAMAARPLKAALAGKA